MTKPYGRRKPVKGWSGKQPSGGSKDTAAWWEGDMEDACKGRARREGGEEIEEQLFEMERDSMKKGIKIECPSCNGTGVYVGMGERDGAAVVCSACRGSGAKDFSYTPFTKRKMKKGVVRVYRSSGFVISAVDTEVGGKLLPFSKFGCSYDEWLDGAKPKQITFLACPMLMDQSKCHDINGFVDRCESFNGGYFSNIRGCINQPNKKECWEVFNNGEA